MSSLITQPWSSTRSIISNLTNDSDSSKKQSRFYARVLGVVIDDSDPNWEDLGCSQAQYGIYFSRIGVTDSKEPAVTNFAYCHHNSFRRIPVENEIVVVEQEINIEARNDSKNTNFYTTRYYWVDIVPVWNHPHLNAYPDTVLDGNGSVNTGKYFKEAENINPLQLVPGDLSIEGRHGNTIRFGGTEYSSAEITKGHNGDPYIIIRNGQGVEESKGDKAIYEDIDKDKSSIYLLSNHKVALTQANDKRKAWKDDKPDKADTYEGAQIVVNSDRIYLNAREKDIELSSKDATGINAKLVSIDGKDYVAFDADKIYLGEVAFRENEPVLLGETSVKWLRNLCNTINKLLTTMGTTTTPTQLPALALQANVTKVGISNLVGQLPTLESKKVFTE